MKYFDIKLNGEVRTVRMGLKTIGDTIQHFDNKPEKFLSAVTGNPYETLPLVIYYGMRWHEERQGRSLKYSIMDVIDWVDEEGLQSDQMNALTQAFIRSMYENVPGIRDAIDEAEKKTPGIRERLIGPETSSPLQSES